MITASQLTERVRIERPVTADDGYGGKTVSWTELATLFAEVKAVTGAITERERLVGEQRNAYSGYRVTVRLRSDVTAAMRLVWKTHLLLIHSLHETEAALSMLCYEGEFMSSLALMEVQRALYTKLNGDGVLMGMITGVYDDVPQHTALPYLVIGDGSQNLRPADAAIVTECRLQLQVWTAAGGRKSALTILNRLHALLHLGTLTLSGFQLVILGVEQAATTLAEQGERLMGSITLSVTVVEA